jgi:uncharacterized membrane protein YtjA (UPF0391 family)
MAMLGWVLTFFLIAVIAAILGFTGIAVAAAEIAKVILYLSGTVLTMLMWVLTFLIISIIAGVLGFTGIAIAAAEIARITFLIFIILFVVSLVMHLLEKSKLP